MRSVALRRKDATIARQEQLLLQKELDLVKSIVMAQALQRRLDDLCIKVDTLTSVVEEHLPPPFIEQRSIPMERYLASENYSNAVLTSFLFVFTCRNSYTSLFFPFSSSSYYNT